MFLRHFFSALVPLKASMTTSRRGCYLVCSVVRRQDSWLQYKHHRWICITRTTLRFPGECLRAAHQQRCSGLCTRLLRVCRSCRGLKLGCGIDTPSPKAARRGRRRYIAAFPHGRHRRTAVTMASFPLCRRHRAVSAAKSWGDGRERAGQYNGGQEVDTARWLFFFIRQKIAHPRSRPTPLVCVLSHTQRSQARWHGSPGLPCLTAVGPFLDLQTAASTALRSGDKIACLAPVSWLQPSSVAPETKSGSL